MRAPTLLLLTCAALGAQTTDETAWPAFDLVSLKHDGSTYVTIQVQANGGSVPSPARSFAYLPTKVSCKLPLSALIGEAYGVKSWQIVAPAWAAVELYDFTGIMPDGTSRETARLMLRRALAERFGLKLRRERKEAPVYLLMVIPGTKKLEQAPPGPNGYRYKSTRTGFEAEPGMTMQALATELSGRTGKPVFDETQRAGVFKVRLDWMSETGEDLGSGIAGAVSQIGLKLAPEKRMIDYLVLEHAEKDPTAN